MPRRASSTGSPLGMVLTLILVAGALGGGWWMSQRVGDPYRTLTPLDVPGFLQNASSLRGNTYKMTATVGSRIAWSPATGGLYAVEVESGSGTEVLPLLVPAEFTGKNIQKGQQFTMRVEIDDRGVLIVRDMQKV